MRVNDFDNSRWGISLKSLRKAMDVMCVTRMPLVAAAASKPVVDDAFAAMSLL